MGSAMDVSKKIYVALPSYKDAPSCLTLTSMVQAKVECAKENWSLTIDPLVGSGDIAHVRNVYIHRFLSAEFTDLLFWDDDLGCKPGDFTRLFKHPVDFVGGTYPQKRDPQVFPLRGRNLQRPKASFELIPLDGIPAGFMRLTRNAIELMTKAYPEAYYEDEFVGTEIHAAWNFFDPIFTPATPGKPGKRLSEDLSFCKRWRDLGHEIYADPRLYFYHTGKKTYQGALVDYLSNLEAQRVAAE